MDKPTYDDWWKLEESLQKSEDRARGSDSAECPDLGLSLDSDADLSENEWDLRQMRRRIKAWRVVIRKAKEVDAIQEKRGYTLIPSWDAEKDPKKEKVTRLTAGMQKGLDRALSDYHEQRKTLLRLGEIQDDDERFPASP